MRRREFVSLLGGAATWPVAARAQQSGKLPIVGYLIGGTPEGQRAWAAAFVQRLRELGWIEGRTVTIEYRWGEGRSERFAEVAAEFVRLKVNVILAGGTEAALAAGRQSRHRQGARRHHAIDAARPRRRGDRVSLVAASRGRMARVA